MSLARLTDDLPSGGARAFGMETGAGAAPEPGGEGGTAAGAIDSLAKFIPTEMLAPYVAFLAYAFETDALAPASVYWWFLVATPLVSVFFQFARKALDDRPWPSFGPAAWRAVAATAAFAVWGLAPPGAAFQAGVGGPAVAGLAALIVSPVLTGADAIVLRLMGVRGGSR